MTSARLRVGARSRLGVAALAGVIALVAFTMLGWVFQWTFMWGYVGYADSDLAAFRAGASVIADGGALYDATFGPGGWTYPPFGGLVMLPLLAVPEAWLRPLSYVVNVSALLVVVWLCAGPLLRRVASRGARIAVVVGVSAVAVATTPVADVLGLGQIGLLLLLLVTVDLVVVGTRGSRWHGVLLGVATAVKLTPGLFVVHLAITRQWRAAATALGTTVACWLAAAAVLRDDTITYVTRAVPFHLNDQIDGFGDWVYNQSWRGLVDGLPAPWANTLWVALSVATLVAGLWAAQRARRDPVLVLGILGIVSVLVTPIAWHHHAVWVVPGLLALVGDARSR